MNEVNKVFYVFYGGFTEKPKFSWERHGSGTGRTLEEACDDAFRDEDSS